MQKCDFAIFAIIGSLLAFSSCGNAHTMDTSEQEPLTASETTTVKVKASEIKQEPEITKQTSETEAKASESVISYSLPQAPVQTEEDFTISAVNTVLEGIAAMQQENYEEMLKLTNFGDMYRFLNDLSNGSRTKPETDDDIYREVYVFNNADKYKDTFDFWQSTKELLKDKPILRQNFVSMSELSEAEYFHVNNLVSSLVSSQEAVPDYTEYYKVNFTYGDEEIVTYVVKDKSGNLRYDIGFCTMGNGINSLF